jgi:hypothetical protein
MKSIPRLERVQYDSLRLIEKSRSARSAALLGGGTIGLRVPLQGAGHILIRFVQVLAVRLHWVCVLRNSSLI